MESIADKLAIIKNSFKDIKTALINKGQVLEGDITTYASAIDSIKVGGDIKSLCEKTLTKINVPEDTTIIKDYAFANTENIIVTVDKDIEIEPFAFSGSSGTVATPNGVWTVGEHKVICEQLDPAAILYNLEDGTALYILAENIYQAGNQGSYVTDNINGYVIIYSYYVAGADLLYFVLLEDGTFRVTTPTELSRGYEYTLLFSFRMDWDNITIKLDGGDVGQIASTAALSDGDILYFNNKLVEDVTFSPTIVKEGATASSNSFALYNKDYIPYIKDGLYLKSSDSLFIHQPKKTGSKLTVVPDKDVVVNLSYGQVTLKSDYCTVIPGTEVTYKIEGDYKLVDKTVTVNEDMTEYIVLEPSVAEEVVLSGTFDSSSYSRDYMVNATKENITITDGAMVCTSTGNYTRSYGYIEFVTPATGGTLSVTASIDLNGTATSGSNTWSGGEIVLSETLYETTDSSFINTSATDKHLFFGRTSAVASKTVTRELEGHKVYYLCFGTGTWSGSGNIPVLSITNITFTAEEA